MWTNADVISRSLATMNSPPVLSAAQQIEVLLSRVDVATWSLQHLGLPAEWRDTNEDGNTERCQAAVNRVFTLSRADIEASLAAKGLHPENLWPFSTEPDSRDGTYFIARGKEWEFYHQERGHQWAGAIFDDLAEARKLVLNSWIPVWLELLHVPCRTKDGKHIVTL